MPEGYEETGDVANKDPNYREEKARHKYPVLKIGG